MNIYSFFSPFYLSRRNSYKGIKYISQKYRFNGKILDVGCGSKPYKHLFPACDEYIGIDYKNFSDNKSFQSDKPDLYFTKSYDTDYILPFSANSFDHVFAFQVLEHHPYPNKLISELFRIVKKGGNLLLSVPYVSGIHEAPHDYQRYTKFGLIQLFKDYKCRFLEFENEGYFFTSISMLCNENICNFVNKSKINFFFGALIYPPFLLFQYVALILELFFKSENIVRGYILFVKKE